MVKLLAKIGRLSTVIIITLIAVLASLGTTMVAVTLLNQQGFGLHTEIAAILSAGVALVVAPPIAWFLVDLLLRVHRVEQKMRSLASYDSLTGLLSRHAFFDNANNYVSLARRELRPFSVMIIDLDHFKLINDRYGHMAAHIRTVLSGVHLSIPVAGGRLVLGTWQGVYLWEHRSHPHRRRIALHLLAE